MLNLVQQTVLVAGQTNKTISYHRRLSALAGAMKSSSQAKSMTKDKKALLENSGKGLFGKDFHEQITDAKKIKAQKRSKELLFNVFQQQRTNKRFSTGPPQSKLPRQAPPRKANISFKQRSDDFSPGRKFNSHNKAQFKNSGKQNSNLRQRNSTTTVFLLISAPGGY